jgi:transposase InsO family protein
MRPDIDRRLVIDALETALFQRCPEKGRMILHSDRGSQQAPLDQHRVLASNEAQGNH